MTTATAHNRIILIERSRFYTAGRKGMHAVALFHNGSYWASLRLTYCIVKGAAIIRPQADGAIVPVYNST